MQTSTVVVGLDQGGTTINATVLAEDGRFLLAELVETPSLVREGPEKAMTALVEAFDAALERTGIDRASVRAVGTGHARSGQRRRAHLQPGVDELRSRGLARLRHPRRPRTTASVCP